VARLDLLLVGTNSGSIPAALGWVETNDEAPEEGTFVQTCPPNTGIGSV
jgi:hypothetical protein